MVQKRNKHEYNLTHLDPMQAAERGIVHRDMIAHALRWTHVLKLAKIGQRILDYGSGTGQLAEVMYRNRYKPSLYLGLEYSANKVATCKLKYQDLPWAEFKQLDIIKEMAHVDKPFDIIASFEVVEHVNKKNVDSYFQNMKAYADENTIILISTPVYDEHVGAASNHIIDGVVQEFRYEELKNAIERNGFEIVDVFGTFASQKDYKPIMNDWQTKMFEHLTKYYDSNLISNLMAPFFPEHSRNCLWRLRIK